MKTIYKSDIYMPDTCVLRT